MSKQYAEPDQPIHSRPYDREATKPSRIVLHCPSLTSHPFRGLHHWHDLPAYTQLQSPLNFLIASTTVSLNTLHANRLQKGPRNDMQQSDDAMPWADRVVPLLEERDPASLVTSTTLAPLGEQQNAIDATPQHDLQPTSHSTNTALILIEPPTSILQTDPTAGRQVKSSEIITSRNHIDTHQSSQATMSQHAFFPLVERPKNPPPRVARKRSPDSNLTDLSTDDIGTLCRKVELVHLRGQYLDSIGFKFPEHLCEPNTYIRAPILQRAATNIV